MLFSDSVQHCAISKSHSNYPSSQQISAEKVAGICFFSWYLLWQDSQKCWHCGHHFANLARELCPLRTSTHRFRSTFQLSS